MHIFLCLLAAFNAAVNVLDTHGIHIFYHNHEMEFAKIDVDGKNMTLMDYFLLLTDPRVKLQVDVGWAAFAGVDEVTFLRTHIERVASIHLKDFARGFKVEHREKDVVAVGTGIIHLPEIIALSKTAQIQSRQLIIDQDCSQADIIEDLSIGLDNCCIYA